MPLGGCYSPNFDSDRSETQLEPLCRRLKPQVCLHHLSLILVTFSCLEEDSSVYDRLSAPFTLPCCVKTPFEMLLPGNNLFAI